MLGNVRGGAEVRAAPLLALLTIAGLGLLPGCRKPALPLARRFVRIDALLPLHPAWAQVVSLQRAEAAFAAAPREAATLQWAGSTMPQPFTPPVIVPQSLARERQNRIAEETSAYLSQVADFVRRRNQARIEREERAGRKQVDAQIAQEAATREEALRAANQIHARDLSRQLRALGFRDAALRSQIRVFTDQPLRDATLQHQTVRAQMDALTLQRDALLAYDPTEQVANEMEPKRQQLYADLHARLQKQLAALNQAGEDRLARARARLEKDMAPVSAASAPPAALKTPLRPLTLASLPETSSALHGAKMQVNAALARRLADWEAQRQRLIAVIRTDTAKAVEQVARRRHWALAPEGTPGATDATGEAAKALRIQWQQGAAQ